MGSRIIVPPAAHGLRRVAMPYMGDLAEVSAARAAGRTGQRGCGTRGWLSAHEAMPVLYWVGSRLPLRSRCPGWCCCLWRPLGSRRSWRSRSCGWRGSPSDQQRCVDARRRPPATAWPRCAGRCPNPWCPSPRRSSTRTTRSSSPSPSSSLRRGAEPQVLAPAVRTAARSISRGLGARRGFSARPRPRPLTHPGASPNDHVYVIIRVMRVL